MFLYLIIFNPQKLFYYFYCDQSLRCCDLIVKHDATMIIQTTQTQKAASALFKDDKLDMRTKCQFTNDQFLIPYWKLIIHHRIIWAAWQEILLLEARLANAHTSHFIREVESSALRRTVKDIGQERRA